MAKCNTLGRGDARSLRKLEKAKEKIQKLKVSPVPVQWLKFDMVNLNEKMY